MNAILKKIAVGVGAFALVGFIAGILVNSSRVAAVTVTLLPGIEEPKDVVLPGQAGAPPDYRLQVRSTDAWIDCGTFQNTQIGDGLTWTVPGALPERVFAGYKLLERDRGFDDLLDEVPTTEQPADGNSFRFEHTTEFAMDAGFTWFMAHPIGRIIGLTFGIMVGLWLFAQFAV